MGKKAPKSTKKFIASGNLKKTIESRKKHRTIRKKVEGRRGASKKVRTDSGQKVAQDEESEEDVEQPKKKNATSKEQGKMSVDDFLNGNFMDGWDEEDDQEEEEDAISESDEEDMDDDASFGSIDDLEDEGENHLMELSKLAEKDPEFYKYLQENDKELLDFDPDSEMAGTNEDDDEGSEGEQQTPVLKKEIVQGWQKAILTHHSLRSLRKLLAAFRVAVHADEAEEDLPWRIEDPLVYNKVIMTSLRYTPVVLEHHAPSKTLPNGKFKPPTQTQKFKTIQKLILSYFNNIIHFISQSSNVDNTRQALTQSAKIIPFIISSRKTVKSYLKKCLELWSSAEDGVRIEAFLSIRKLASATDSSILDHVLKGSYLTLVRSSKSTNNHTLPSINLMKNSATEVYCFDHAASYQHAFGYIRQLAIHLRNSMKMKTKDGYKQVYNWQFVHSMDFWSMVLARACESSENEVAAKASQLQPLIYPLVQVSLGAIRLGTNARSHPFHLHIIRSLLHIMKHTDTYIPLTSYILPILTSVMPNRTKSSTLRPLDFEVHIRTPQQYLKTRILHEGLCEEIVYLLAEWLTCPSVHGSIAFPEITIPILVSLRKALKSAKGSNGKEAGFVKTLIERIEDSARWTEQERRKVTLAPEKINMVAQWERDLRRKLDETPLRRYVLIQRNAREKRRRLVEKALIGEDEMIDG